MTNTEETPASFDALGLLSHHRALLEASDISPDAAAARGYRSVTNGMELHELGFAGYQCDVPTLLLPVHTTAGLIGSSYHRPDKPRTDKQNRVVKYEFPKGGQHHIDVPPAVRCMLGSPTIPLAITEGSRKADSLLSHGFASLSIGGVWNWRGRNDLDGLTALGDWDDLHTRGRLFYLIFDSDQRTKAGVNAALKRLRAFLLSRHAKVLICHLPPGPDGAKNGVDDYLHAGGDLEALLERSTEQLVVEPPNKRFSLNGHKPLASGGAMLIEQADDRDLIDVTVEDLRAIAAQAWASIQRANAPPRLFRRAGLAVRLEPAERGELRLRDMTPDRMRHELGQAAQFMQNGQPAYPPAVVAHDLLATPDPPFPMLSRITERPVYAADGRLQTTRGYSAASQTYLDLPDGFRLPDVPENPTLDDLAQARAFIFDDWWGDFPFVGQADRAHALAALILPAVRDLIDGPTPGHMFEAPTAGSGKGLLTDVIVSVSVGRQVGIVPQARDEEEFRKRLLAQLLEGQPAIMLDNINRPLNSGVLSAALTARQWSDRILGRTETALVPVRCLWVATANNPVFTTELARRFVRVRLDPRRDRPWLRNAFKHSDLRGWTSEHCGELLAAIFTIVQAWLALGRPVFEGRLLGSFESWTRVIGGILHCAGVDGFLTNLDEFYESADTEGTGLRAFVSAWWEKFEGGDVAARDLFPLAASIDGLDLGRGNERAQQTYFGQRVLGQLRDRVVGDFCVKFAGKSGHQTRWRLLRAGTEGDQWSSHLGESAGPCVPGGTSPPPAYAGEEDPIQKWDTENPLGLEGTPSYTRYTNEAPPPEPGICRNCQAQTTWIDPGLPGVPRVCPDCGLPEVGSQCCFCGKSLDHSGDVCASCEAEASERGTVTVHNDFENRRPSPCSLPTNRTGIECEKVRKQRI